MLPIGQVKTGSKILVGDQPHLVLSADHLNLGRGQAKLAVKLKNLLTGSVTDKTFQGSDRIESAEVSYQPAQFLYAEENRGQFMTNDTFEQQSLPLEDQVRKLLKEGTEVSLTTWNDQVIEVNLPTKVDLAVIYTEPGFKGNTSGDPRKPATVETGATVQVPLFINIGDTIRIKTDTGQYDSRV
jgi:elongation factor P